ncbi:hypothetical protein BT69DRAFT_1082464 [Atractiella rhizophila]|nr:hypothetical protein BT69DRAFT_1082464 [Atractiella rhizophila]
MSATTTSTAASPLVSLSATTTTGVGASPMMPSPSGSGSTTANPYTVIVSSKSYHLSHVQITSDAPNLFSEHFLSPAAKAASALSPNIPPTSLFGSSFALTQQPMAQQQPLPLIIPHKNAAIFELIVLHLSGYDILPLEEKQCPAGMNMSNFENNLVTDLRFFRLRGLLEKLFNLKALTVPIPKSPPVPPLVWCNDDIEPFFDTPSSSSTYLRQVAGPFDISPRPPPAQNSNFRLAWPESVRFVGKGLIVADGKNGETGRPLLLRAKNVQVMFQLDLGEMCVRVSFKFMVASDRKFLLAKVPTLLMAPVRLLPNISTKESS